MTNELEEHDNCLIHCRMLGHQVPFSYCRQPGSPQPCRKIFDCWFETFDIAAFMREHYTQDQIDSVLRPPKPKTATLIEMIQQAQRAANTKMEQ